MGLGSETTRRGRGWASAGSIEHETNNRHCAFRPSNGESLLGGVAVSAFNWSAIDWISLVALSLLVLVAARLGERLSFGSRGVGAVVTTLVFATGFAAWSYFSVHETLVQAVAMLMPAAPS
jgi:hypothetical protein